MKQAVLITAYKDFDQLYELAGLFEHSFNLYIHVDRKADLPELWRNRILELETVKYIGQDYVVNWGGFNHLKAYLQLADEALKDPENLFFHLITGQDFPVATADRFNLIASDALTNERNYMFHFKLPQQEWEGGSMERLNRYNFYDLLDAKKHRKWILRLLKIQQLLGLERSMRKLPENLFGGSTYWSLNRSCLQYVLDYTATHQSFLNRFKYTFCAEEIYFQTLILNSEYAGTVINDNLRFIDWKSGRGGYPAFLDQHDYLQASAQGSLFARKVDKKEFEILKEIRNHNQWRAVHERKN